MDQLDLFADTDAEPLDQLHIVAVCPWCGDVLDAVPVEGGPGAPWYAASLWCYLAQKQHNDEHHPERQFAAHTDRETE